MDTKGPQSGTQFRLMEMKDVLGHFQRKLLFDHEKLDQSHQKHFPDVSGDLGTTKLILKLIEVNVFHEHNSDLIMKIKFRLTDKKGS